MKQFIIFFSLWFFVGSLGLAQDEDDIPPPPMPDYMQEAGYETPNGFDREEPAPEAETADVSEREPASAEPLNNLGDQTPEDIKNEFLQAGDELEDDIQETAMPAVEPVDESDIAEGDAESISDQPEVIIEDVVQEDMPVEETPVEVADQEFQQAEIQDPNAPAIKEAYVNPDQSVSEAPVAAVAPQEAEAVAEPVVEEPLDKLADVEEKLEQREIEQEEALAGVRAPANKKKFKSGMYKFKEECTMRAEPRSLSDEAGTIRAGRKLWIDPHNSGWHKAYKKSGTVYISADCLD